MSETARPSVATTARRGIRYDIQALRAIAVLLVVVNHVWPTHVPGGYVGVDVFFVISGFLITAHLLGEIIRTGKVSLARFYARRARRLLPAALTVSLLALGASLLWLPVDRWERIGREIFGATAYVLNWMLAASSVDYSARNDAATPVQHYWSLSVEEQFYLLWPLTLLLLSLIALRLARRRTRDDAAPRMLIPTIGVVVIALASFGFSIWETEHVRSAAYFNTLGRIWEFMLGALLAVGAAALTRAYSRAPHSVRTLRGIAQLLGYGMIAYAALSFNTQTPFPGPWALLPAAGTALVIGAGPETPRWSPARLLAWRPVQYIGDISYSLYLWHWPIIIIAPFVLLHELNTVDRLVVVALSIVLASATKHFVEDPGRTRLFTSARPRRTLLAIPVTFALVGAMSVVTANWAGRIQAERAVLVAQQRVSDCFGAGSMEPGAQCGDPFGAATAPTLGAQDAPWNGLPPECALLPQDRQIYQNGRATLTGCDFPMPAGRPAQPPLKVWLVGDSHAEQWKDALYSVARGNGWQVTSSIGSGCPTLPLPLAMFRTEITPASDTEACMKWGDDTSARLLQERPDLVVVSNFSAAETVADGTGRPQDAQFADAMTKRFGEWTRQGATVVVIHDVPSGQLTGSDCVALRAGLPRGCLAPQDVAVSPDHMVDAVRATRLPSVSSIDLTDRFCRDGQCSGVIGGVPVYYDGDHITRSFSATLSTALGERLSAILGRQLLAPIRAL